MGMLKDKTALITGAARGIGRDIAVTFAREGANIACLDLDLQGLKETAAEVEKTGRRVVFHACDISEFGDLEKKVTAVSKDFSRLDILVNNAGVTRDNLLLRMTEGEWDLVLRVNLKGSFNCSKAVARQMIKQREGRIINIASIIGIIGNAGQANYAASKGGLIALTKSLAKEFAGRNVNVNAIAPGFIKTRMTEELPEKVKSEMLARIPLAKLGEVSDVSGAALFLAGPLSAYITGQVMVVDGGMVM